MQKRDIKIFVCFSGIFLEEVQRKQYDLCEIKRLVTEEVKIYAEKMKVKEKYLLCTFYEDKCSICAWAAKKYNKVIITITKMHPPILGDVMLTHETNDN